MKDYYKILAVAPTASQPEVRKAYYKLAHQFHPDKNPNAANQHKFLEINEAYEILGDKNKREIYHYRWVNFQNPPQAKTYASRATTQTARPQTRTVPRSQPYYQRSYQNYTKPTYQEYEPLVRRICQVVLIFSALILIDYILAAPYKNEIIQDYAVIYTKSAQSYVVYTEHTKFRVPSDSFQQVTFTPGHKLDIWQTPLFRQIIKIGYEGQNFVVNEGGIYHTFFFLVLLQAAMAGAGIYRNFSWANRLNFGTMSGLCALITLLIMAIT